jgi:chitin synthase
VSTSNFFKSPSFCFSPDLLTPFLRSGESGSGKSEQFQQAVDYSISLSSTQRSGKNSTRISNNINHVLTIINAFSRAKATQHDNASKCATYLQLFFSERGRLSGACLFPYALEKHRVTSAGQDERNFHVFYNLLAGEEKASLGLSDRSTFHYLSKTNTPRASTIDDIAGDLQLRAALKATVFQKQRVAQIYQVLAAILHLGNIVFIEDPNNAQDAAITKNVDSLSSAADLLGVDPNALMSALTFKSKLIKRDITTLFLNPEQASKQRDDLAQALYCLLFTWLIEQCNDRMTPNSSKSFIGLLDIPGWIARSNNDGGFDQLAYHFIQETVHQFMLHSIFDRDREGCIEQGLTVDTTSISTTATVDLFTHPSKGLYPIMSTQASRQHQRYDDDVTLMDNYASANKLNDQLLTFKKSDTGSKLFTIQHFWGPSTYEPRSFSERNQDYLSNDFIALFCGNAYNPSTTNGLVVCLFDDAILGQDDGVTRNRVLSQQQSIKPLRSPISATVATNGDAKSTKSATGDVPTIADLLVTGIGELIQALSNTLSWHVLCIRPNDLSLSNSCDIKRVAIQQSHFKILEIIKRLQNSGYYTTVFTCDEFWDRYHVSIPITLNAMVDPALSTREKCVTVAQSLGWNEAYMAVGKSTVINKNKAALKNEIIFITSLHNRSTCQIKHLEY